MEYKLYKGYILGPGEQHPAVGIYEVGIYQRFDAAKDYTPWHTSESELEAMLWIDGQAGYDAGGWATQADVDELNGLAIIELSNRAELQNVVSNALSNAQYYENTWREGKMTPKDLAEYMKSLWTQASYDIESKG